MADLFDPSQLVQYYLNSPPQFALIEKEVIDRFDRLFGVDAKGDELARASFVDQLRQLFDASEMDDDLNLQVDRFLASINSFLDLLLDVRALPEGQEVSRIPSSSHWFGRLTNRSASVRAVSRGSDHLNLETHVGESQIPASASCPGASF